MKKDILVMISMMLLISCNSTKRIIASNESKQLSTVIDVPNKNSNDIYTAVNEWMILTFVDAESVIQFQDKEAGKVMGKYVGSYPKSNYNNIPFKSVISVDVKDEKARIKFLDPQWKRIFKDGSEWTEVQYADTIDKIEAEWQKLVESLKSHLVKKSDW